MGQKEAREVMAERPSGTKGLNGRWRLLFPTLPLITDGYCVKLRVPKRGDVNRYERIG